MNKTILLLNGPNLNLLGLREPEIYGLKTLQDIETACRLHGGSLGFEVDCRQSNHEGTLIDWIQEARNTTCAIILNAGGYTHTSVALHDALKAYDGLKIEMHISNPKNRESFRHISLIEPASDVLIAGFGTAGYNMAIDAVAEKIAL